MLLMFERHTHVIRSSSARKAVELVKEAQNWAQSLSSLVEALDLVTASENEPSKLAVFCALAALGRVRLPQNSKLAGEKREELLQRAQALANQIPTFIGRQVCRMAVAYVMGQGDLDWGNLAKHSLLDVLENGNLEGTSFDQIILDWCALTVELPKIRVSEQWDDLKLNTYLTVLENQVKNIQEQASSPVSRVMLPIFYAAAAQVSIDIDPSLAKALALQGLENSDSLREKFAHDEFLEVYLEVINKGLKSIETTATEKLVAGF